MNYKCSKDAKTSSRISQGVLGSNFIALPGNQGGRAIQLNVQIMFTYTAYSPQFFLLYMYKLNNKYGPRTRCDKKQHNHNHKRCDHLSLSLSQSLEYSSNNFFVLALIGSVDRRNIFVSSTL